MPSIRIPLLNPTNFVDVSRTLAGNYHWKHFDGWTSYEQQSLFENAKPMAQKVQRNDIFFLQVKADYSPIRAQVRNSQGKVVIQQVMSNVANVASLSYYQDQIAFDTSFTPDGYYLLEITGGDPISSVLQSEVLNVRTSHPGTLLFSYKNSFNNLILWETGIEMTYRLDGVLPYTGPASVRTGYLDQPLQAQTIKGDAANLFKLYVGTDGGLTPNQMAKIDAILDQNIVTIDGKGFAVSPGATWNIKKIDRYPWLQGSIDMREVINRGEKIFDSAGLQEQKYAVDFVIETKLFGPLQPGSNNDNTAEITFID